MKHQACVGDGSDIETVADAVKHVGATQVSTKLSSSTIVFDADEQTAALVRQVSGITSLFKSEHADPNGFHPVAWMRG